ncbi:MAG: GTPase ObgE [Armatimonadetes bacterium]|nr:GTPase ObgE [Armatimonadota bacterium]
MFVDEVKIKVKAGKGGNGVVAFRREKYVPKGGPAGGSGGQGGHVILQAEPHLTTLLDFRYQQHYAAPNGEAGSGSQKHGHDGEDLILKVPVGTVVYEEGREMPIADLTVPGQQYIVARGGRGGRGNAVFATSRRQAPRIAERGEPGEEKALRLELKLLADVGLVGFPNVGKSTLIAACSAARPKIADYPFTTLVPNLGVVRVEEKNFVMADIPGLIEGAHEGQGLGIQFLRHIERTRAILHVLDVSGITGRDPMEDYRIIRNELAAYNDRLAELPEVVALNKIDLPGAAEIAERVEGEIRELGREVFRISAATNEGITPILYATLRILEENPVPVALVDEEEMVVIRFGGESQENFNIRRTYDGAFQVEGEGVVRSVAMTDTNLDEGLRRLHRHLERLGVIQALRQAGARNGDTIRVGDAEMEFVEEAGGWEVDDADTILEEETF